MIFHAKALEMLTIAYRHLVDIDTESDLEEFRNTFTQSNLPSFAGSKHSLNSSATSKTKNSYEDLFAGNQARSRSAGPTASQADQKRSRSNEMIGKKIKILQLLVRLHRRHKVKK